MRLLRAIYGVIIDALFPLAEAEKAVFALAPEEALRVLPPATPYDDSVEKIAGAASIFAYKDERVSKLIWSIKYKKSAKAVAIGGYALYKKLLERRETVIIPIPITTRRRRERGYNQCEILLDEIKRLDTERRFTYEHRLLLRTRHKSRQTLKGREDRLASSAGIFAVDTAIEIGKDSYIVVIDDVLTTGSTMSEAVRALERAGFRHVSALTLAH